MGKIVLLGFMFLISMATAGAVGPISTVKDLQDALSRASDGDVLELDSSVVFDLTGTGTLKINRRITLQSHRPDSFPILIHRGAPLPLIEITAKGSILKGIKILGVETDTKQEEIARLNRQGERGVYKFPVTRGIEIKADEVQIRNCEIAGFSHAAIFIKSGRDILIRENYIHHNQRSGLGYGVTLDLDSEARILLNKFDYNRHSVAGTGSPGQSYEAAFNWFGPHHTDSTLDMHGGKDRKDGTEIAGHTVHIHHNMILASNVPIFIHRGIAQDKVHIHHNIIHQPRNQAIGYYNGVKANHLEQGKFIFELNEFR